MSDMSEGMLVCYTAVFSVVTQHSSPHEDDKAMSNSQIISFCNIASDKKKEACAIFKRQVAWFGGDQSSWVDLLAISVVRIIFFPYSAARKTIY